MASTFNFLLTLITLVSIAYASESEVISAPFKPNGLFLPVRKDVATGLHVTNIRTQQSVPLLIDLNGRFLWLNCEKNYYYLSSTYHAPFCHSTQCAQAGVHYCHKCSSTPRPGCHNNTCAVITTNPVTRINAIGELAQDSFSIQSTRPLGSNLGPFVTISRFLFVCSPSSLLQEPLPKNVQGIVGLGHGSVSLPIQLASYFGFPPQFSLCIPSSTQKNGAIFIGSHGLYNISQHMTYTPITIGSQGQYFIPVRSIRINNKTVPLNTSLMSTRNFGTSMISTTSPYTVLEHNIFQAFTQFFADQLSGVTQVKPPVSPFGLCFNSNNLINTSIPNIQFVMQNKNVIWTIAGTNSMVQARPGVSCLAFVDAGLIRPKAPIVIGVYQLEDNFLQFDLARSRLGFSSSLLSRNTTCSNFDFTSTFINEMD